MKDNKKREKMIIDFKFDCLKFCLILQLAINYNFLKQEYLSITCTFLKILFFKIKIHIKIFV